MFAHSKTISVSPAVIMTNLETLFATQTHLLNRSSSIRQPVYDAIKEVILSGQIAPNQPLIEEQLAASLGVSRTPVREALAILQHERIIGPGTGRGLFVYTLTRNEFVEMFTANEVIEPYLARRAALLATDEQLQSIQESVQQGKAYTARGDKAGFLRASRDFHRRMGEAAGNTLLTDFVLANEERADMYIMHTGKAVNVVNMTMSMREHQAIYEALAQHDPEAAERCVIYHAHSLRERWAELFANPKETTQL